MEKDSKKRINVALMVNCVANDYTYSVCRGAAIAAEEYDINLLIVPGRELNANWNSLKEYEYQNNIIYSFITKNNIDVLLISMGTIGMYLDKEQLRSFMNKFEGLKVIIMEARYPGYPCITFSLNGLKQCITHLITAHGKKRIGFVSAPSNNPIGQERLAVYKKVLTDFGMKYDEKLVVYGDFTDSSEQAVRELIRKNTDDPVDAVCFANDSMALAGYRVFCERGIKIGKAVSVTGFDDAPFASVISPPLSTVKAAIMSMGYRSVEAAIKYEKEGQLSDFTIDTYFICRESCGCKVSNQLDIKYESGADVSDIADRIRQHVIDKSSVDIISKPHMIRLKSFIAMMIENIVVKDDFSPDEVGNIIEKFLSNNNMLYYNLDALNELISILKKISLKISDEKKQVKIFSAFQKYYDMVNEYYAGKLFSAERENSQNQLVFTKIANDMMANGKDENACFSYILDDICNMKMKSCYIYVYEKSFLNKKLTDTYTTPVRPDKIFLKAYKNGQKKDIPPDDEQEMSSEDFMNNRFMPADRSKLMLLKPLFFNEEQYGILLAETTVNGMLNIETASQQLCTAIKMTRFMNLLETALSDVRQANEILSRESVSDQLTGIYNRRGLILESEKTLEEFRHAPCRCAVVFADLDSLKVINDTFGHDEGDFAIRHAAAILKENLRASDIVGRIGGDEFVAFVMGIEDQKILSVADRIKKSAEIFNQSSSKPYNVELSVGIYCFDSLNGETIDDLMSKADHILYENKQLKKNTPIKDLLKKN